MVRISVCLLVSDGTERKQKGSLAYDSPTCCADFDFMHYTGAWAGGIKLSSPCRVVVRK